ncbi:hypothetical protein HU200_045179 [Digitaria exilis]|uniref:Uncharacterized protein n=1 Tax=Digitaria exilis TaxID=1010633 RepID=A0A835AZY0_9POAL|nr:hypothetical protein HU200_045179 [Digitaria exilis]
MSPLTHLRAHLLLTILVLLLVAAPFHADAQPASPDPAANDACADPAVEGACHNVPKALRLKLIAIPTILVASVIGVCLPLLSRSVPALRPDRNLFVIVKAFASGVILATGYMHVLPDSFNNLTSPCLPQKPWAEFPFTVPTLAGVDQITGDEEDDEHAMNSRETQHAVILGLQLTSPLHERACVWPPYRLAQTMSSYKLAPQ